MKQLVLDDDTPSQIFFSYFTSFNDIFEWVQQMVMFDEKNIFNLNEQFSCSVEPNETESTFVISGDEDYRELSIETIKPTPLI
tara:strand:- start:4340 stop:4588 length:249 start_codon:yes stop_codon:yes gene_type:complete